MTAAGNQTTKGRSSMKMFNLLPSQKTKSKRRLPAGVLPYKESRAGSCLGLEISEAQDF